MAGSLDHFPKRTKGFDEAAYAVRLNRPLRPRTLPGTFGIEVELEGSRPMPGHIATAVNGISWIAHPDGSLRNGGMEYTLSAPADMPTAVALVNGLYDELRAHRDLRLVTSNRTSTHVHVNVGGWKLNRLAAMVCLWGVVEDVLASWCGETRAGNLFCLRMRDAEWATDYWATAFRTGHFTAGNDYKYLAMNPAAISRFGSLEFRTLRGADGPEIIVDWLRILERLVERSERYADNPSDIAGDVSGLGRDGFITELFGDLGIDIPVPDDYCIYEAVRRVQPIMYALPWLALKPSIDRAHVPDPFGGDADRVARFNDELARAMRVQMRRPAEFLPPDPEGFR